MPDAEHFRCAYCGDRLPWSELAAFDLPIRLCEGCHQFLELLEMPREASE